MLTAHLRTSKLILSQGWCKFYEFSDSDLKAGQELLERLQEKAQGSGEVDWDFVHGLYENAIYGGRVDDAHDILILRSYLASSFNPSVSGGGRSGGAGGAKLGPFALPTNPDYRSYVEMVRALPEEDKPATFGLPANIERSRQRSSSAATIAQLR